MEKIIKVHSDTSSEEHKTFSKKIEAIKTLQEEFEKLSMQLPEAIRTYANVVHPIAQKIAELEKDRLIEIDQFCDSFSFSKRELSLIEDYMCYEILFWTHKYSEDEALMQLFEKYAHMPFHEYISQLYAERNTSSKASFQPLETQQEPSFGSHKKTAAERKIEKNQLEDESRRKKTVRSIYIDLIKVFHPDTEQDEDKKLEKEEISKKITEAYTKNDLFTLLKLETDYLESDSGRLSGMRPDTFQAYLSMLTKQQEDIERAISTLKKENDVIYREMCRPAAKPDKFLRKVKKEMNEMTHILQNQIMILQQQDDDIKPHLLEEMEKQLSRKDIDGLLIDMIE